MLGFQIRVQFRLVLGFSLPESVGNRLRVGASVAVSVLVTLLVRFGGDELGSGLRVADRAVGGSCVDAPR